MKYMEFMAIRGIEADLESVMVKLVTVIEVANIADVDEPIVNGIQAQICEIRKVSDGLKLIRGKSEA